MSTEVNFIVTNLCRVCLSETNPNNCTYLSQYNDSCSVIECISIQTCEDNKMPQLLCFKCTELLNDFREFKMLARQSESVLAECLQNGFNNEFNAHKEQFHNFYKKYYCIRKVPHTEVEPNVAACLDVKDQRKEAVLPDQGQDQPTELENNIYEDNDSQENANDNLQNFDNNWNKTNAPQYPCIMDECNREFFYQAELSVHLKSVHNFEPNIKCSKCQVKFYTHSDLDEHEFESHTKKKQQTIKKPVVSTGRKTETASTEAYSTDNVDKQDGDSMDKDMKNSVKKLPTDSTDCTCEICDKIFSSTYTLKKHMANHGEKKYPCHLCSGQYYLLQQVNRHLRQRHHLKPTFKCDKCSFGKFVLKAHLKLHEEEFHLIVDESTHNPIMESLTKRGRLSNDNAAPVEFKCRICDRNFKDKRNLKDHFMTHGQPTHPCLVAECPRKFYMISRMHRHLKSAHNLWPQIECLKCPRKFFSQACLDEHILERHEKRIVNKSIKHSDKLINRGKEGKGETTKVDRKSMSDTNSTDDVDKLDSESMDVDEEGSEKVYTCKLCEKTYTTPYTLKTHMANHGEKKYACEMCPKKFYALRQANRHLRDTHHMKPAFKCNKCSYGLFVSESYLMIHQEESHKLADKALLKDSDGQADDSAAQGEFICNICARKYKDRRYLKRHMIMHNGPQYSCLVEECAKKFFYPSELYRHLKLNHKLLPEIECRKCRNKFYTQAFLDKHLIERHARVSSLVKSEFPVKDESDDEVNDPSDTECRCEICHKVYSSRKTLSRHLKVHKGHVYPCEVPGCHRTFLDSARIKGHLVKDHNLRPQFPCSQCGEYFITPMRLARHVEQRHVRKSKHKNILCQLCGQGVKDIRRHMMKHENDENLNVTECYRCDLKFRSVDETKAHMRRRHRLKTCERCGEQYRSFDQMHKFNGKKCVLIRVKTSIKYSCEICGKTFNTRRARVVHKKKNHNQTKETECIYCHKIISRHNIAKHYKRVHQNVFKT